MCVETITVKPMYIDDADEPFLKSPSNRDNGIFVTGIDNNKSILDDNLVVETNQYDLYPWSGREDIKQEEEEEDCQNQCNTPLANDHVQLRSNPEIFK